MPSVTGEHNRLAAATADQIADRLHFLFGAGQDNLPVMPSDEGVGSPHLIDSLDDAPLQTIGHCRLEVEIYAIDGGSSVLARGGNIEVMAWRAGMVKFKDHLRLSESCPAPEVLAYNRLAVKDYIEEVLIGSPLKYIASQPPIKPVDQLRWLAEWRILEDVIHNTESEALILMDGSLRGNPLFDMGYQKEILRSAAERNIHVAAVTKQSSLALSQPLPVDLSQTGGEVSPEKWPLWYRRLNHPLPESSGWLGNIFLAGLHPDADKPYRVDINRYDKTDPEKILSMIAAVSDDIEFCGYPYPLAAAHRLARIDNHFRRELIDAIGQALDRKNFSPHIWEYLTGDIHEKLNADMEQDQ